MAAPSKGNRGAGTRTGSTSGVEISGLAAFRRELKTLDDPRAWTKELAALNRVIAKDAAADARSEAVGMGHEHKHFAPAIKGYGSAAAARIRISGEAGAEGAFWGSKQFAQFDEWVGNTWDVGVRGQGPYAINDVIADNADEYARRYGDGFMDIARRAFPDA